MSKFNNFKNYNPDILETIANLSNDEVFTPPKLANQILDLLPKEVWSDSTITFLDPAVKTGIFLREITSRLIDGLADQIPDLQERVNHILTKQVFGIGITELTTLMARRTVYCSMYANGPYSICTEFDDEKGNIIFPDTEHTWDKNGRCEFCGANRESYDGGGNRENYAYPFIHDNFEKEFGNMKFDVIIGNPPYQLTDGGGVGDSSKPIYDIFINKSIELNPRYISMIVPSRWMKGGKGLKEFREKMMKDTRIKEMFDFQDASELFPSVQIDGGICYFLWDKTYSGKVSYNYKPINEESISSQRYLDSKFSSTIIRDHRQYSILKKIHAKNNLSFESIVSARNPYGLSSGLFNYPEKHKDIKLYESLPNESGSFLRVYGVKGIKGGAKRTTGYINEKSVNKGISSINDYKLMFSKAFGTNYTVPPKIIKAGPKEVCTETFLEIGPFKSKKEMESCYSYIETKFFRALLFYNRHSLNISKSSFELIPLQDWSKPWTDEELYKKYKLTEEEIAYIEDNIDPMGDQEDSEEAYPEDSVDLEEEEFED